MNTTTNPQPHTGEPQSHTEKTLFHTDRALRALQEFLTVTGLPDNIGIVHIGVSAPGAAYECATIQVGSTDRDALIKFIDDAATCTHTQTRTKGYNTDATHYWIDADWWHIPFRLSAVVPET